MVIEFQRKAGQKEVYNARDYLHILWFLTHAEDGKFSLNTVKELKEEEFAECIEGLENQNDDLAVMEWRLGNGERFFASIKGETLETLGDNAEENLASLLCVNQEFLQALDLHYLTIDNQEILPYCKPKTFLMDYQLKVF